MPHHRIDGGYAVMACEEDGGSVVTESPDREYDRMEPSDKNEGEENGSVVGCNANNGNASARSANCNNNAGNGNDNYAGAFAVNRGTRDFGKHLASCAASTKITEDHAVNDGCGHCDYGSLPFWDCDNAEIVSSNLRGNAKATDKEAVLDELARANSKRKLKNLKRFFLNREIIEYAFDRTMQRTSASKDAKDYYMSRRSKVCDRIERELTNMTYEASPCVNRTIHKKGKGEKDRHASVYTMYDRIIQTLILIVIEGKFRNMMIRNIYSGINGRSVLSNDRRFCMVNKIRHWVSTHQDKWVGLTDIHHFYESLRMKVVLGEMFGIIVCPYTRWLLCSAFGKTEYLPIGGSMSQLMAMFTVVSADNELLKRYDVELFCFGDNRLIGGDKKEVREAMSFLMSYYEGRYGLHVKEDYQIRKVSDGFRFCKYDYKGSYVHVRAEMRRRAIRAYKNGMQRYAGYKGMLLKTDSKRLRYMIENHIMELTNKHGMRITTQKGDKVKFRDLDNGSEVFPIEYSIEKSEAKAKEGKQGLMVRIVYVHINGEQKRLCHTTEGSEEIVEFFKLVENREAELHQHLHVRHDGTRSYFEEYHTSKEEACELVCDLYGL